MYITDNIWQGGLEQDDCGWKAPIKMKKIILVLLVFFGVTFFYSPGISAAEKNSRKGFTFGLGVGPGYLHSSSGGSGFGMMGDLRFGFGISEQFLVFLEQNTALGFNIIDEGIRSSFSVSSQIFLTSDSGFYLRPSVGVGMIGNFFNGGVGITGGLVVGHEWRLGKSFALSPELQFDYLRAGGANHYNYGAVLDLRWYF